MYLMYIVDTVIFAKNSFKSSHEFPLQPDGHVHIQDSRFCVGHDISPKNESQVHPELSNLSTESSVRDHFHNDGKEEKDEVPEEWFAINYICL